MNKLQELTFNYDQCRKEVLELQKLLARKKSLKEREDILPFFKNRLHLSAFIGSYMPGIVTFDRIEKPEKKNRKRFQEPIL